MMQEAQRRRSQIRQWSYLLGLEHYRNNAGEIDRRYDYRYPQFTRLRELVREVPLGEEELGDLRGDELESIRFYAR
jgi:hypothetical protein